MDRVGRMAAIGLSLIMLVGCAGTRLADARKMTPSGTAFDTALAKGYLERSKLAYSGGDYTSSDRWAEKSMAAARGDTPAPDSIVDYDLPGDTVAELTAARARLVEALDAGARTKTPAAAANAQVMLDCWMQKQAANTIPADITTCRSGFLNSMDEIDAAMAPAAPAPSSYLLFFDWGRSVIPPEALGIVADAAANIRSSGTRSVVVTGFADTSGSAKANQRLSERRAEAVREELIKQGVPAAIITTKGRGEEELIVPTGNNQREPQNRRVRIDLQQPAS
ncbi:MAG: OmpA family protein [Rhodospirillales bacterium]|nr:OmpA family protein [Rhodospirillales bacterium]